MNDKTNLNIITDELDKIIKNYKTQAQNSLKASLFAILIGFLTLICGIKFFYLKDPPDLNLTIISSISGLLIESIGGLYFFMYKKSLEQLNYFYEKSYQTKNINCALDIYKDLKDNTTNGTFLEKIILSLLPPH